MPFKFKRHSFSHKQGKSWPHRIYGLFNLLFFCSSAEYIESIGDGKSEEYKEAERKRIMDLVDNF